MIVVRLSGGLGNQLFQYAFGRRLQIDRGDTLFLDPTLLSTRQNATPRPLYIDRFRIQATVVPFAQLRRETDLWIGLIQGSRIVSIDALQPPNVKNLLIDGNWVSERYFESAAHIIRAELAQIRCQWSAEVIDLTHEIQQCNSVCLHVRRGDYLMPRGAFMGALGAQYYHRAISMISERVATPKFFVFSDDIEWCKQSLKLPEPYLFIEPSQNSPDDTIRDFYLMMNCSHYIIANSTFSWWGAWLGGNQTKNIFAPKRWFAQADMQGACILPPTWDLVEV